MLLKSKTKAGFSDSTNRIRCYFYSLFALDEDWTVRGFGWPLLETSQDLKFP
mgnify:CR=1 FL=1